MSVRGFARPSGVDVRRGGRFAPVTDTSKLDELLVRLKNVAGLKLDYGLMGEGGGPTGPHPNPDADGLSVATIGAIQEYGTDEGVPERSYIRWVGKAKAREIGKAFAEGVRRYIAGQFSQEQLAAHVGDEIVRLMRQRILDRIPPPLAERTKANPKRDRRYIPLFDTGAILEHLRWTVRR